MLVLAGRCNDRESVPFKAVDTLIDALCARLVAMSDARVQQLLTPDVAILAELFPVLTRVKAISQLERVPLEEVESDRVRQLAGNALRELLSRFGNNLKLVCFIDDLQWGDADSAELLLNVLRPPAGPHILLMGTYRSDEAESSRFLQTWKSATEQPDRAIPQTDCEVSPLTPTECVEFVVDVVGIDNERVRAHAREIAEESAGNPLILSELASCYDPKAKAPPSLHIEDILERKLGLLPADARALLEIISVSGQGLSLEEASGSVGHAAVPFSTITRMTSERLVRLIGDEQELAVDTYHDRIRELVLRDMDGGHRQGLHVRLAEVIEASVENDANEEGSADQINPRIYDLAYHFYEGGDQRAYTHQLEAGEAAMRAFAMENAIDHFKKAEEVTPDNASHESQYRLYERQGEAYGKSQRLEESKESYRSAAPHASNQLERAVALGGIGDKYQRQGQYETAIEFFHQALQELGYRCPKSGFGVLLETMLYGTLVHLPWLVRRLTDAGSQARAQSASRFYYQVAHGNLIKGDMLRYTHGTARQVFTANRSRQFDVIALGYSKFSFNYAAFSLPLLSKWFLNGAWNAAQQSGDSFTHALVEAHAGLSYYNLGRLTDSRNALESALETMERQGDSWFRMTCHNHLCHVYAVLGHSEQEIVEASIEQQIGDATQDPLTICWAQNGLADANARMGQLPEAHNHMQKAHIALKNLDAYEPSRAILLNHQGFLLLQSSDYSRAIQVLDESTKLIAKRFFYMEYMLRTYPLLVESLLGPNWLTVNDSAKVRRARSLSLRTRFFGWRFPNLRPHAQRVHGRLLCATGRRGKAMRYFEKSIQSARKLGAEYDEARAMLDLAAVDDRRRDELRIEAVTILKRLKAVIPRAEMWQLGEDPNQSCIAPEFEYSP
jgi:tetratricopeptide (TPR) repeat protein